MYTDRWRCSFHYEICTSWIASEHLSSKYIYRSKVSTCPFDMGIIFPQQTYKPAQDMDTNRPCPDLMFPVVHRVHLHRDRHRVRMIMMPCTLKLSVSPGPGSPLPASFVFFNTISKVQANRVRTPARSAGEGLGDALSLRAHLLDSSHLALWGLLKGLDVFFYFPSSCASTITLAIVVLGQTAHVRPRCLVQTFYLPSKVWFEKPAWLFRGTESVGRIKFNERYDTPDSDVTCPCHVTWFAGMRYES